MYRISLIAWILGAILSGCGQNSTEHIALNGEWRFQIDRNKQGIQEEWYRVDQPTGDMRQIQELGFWESITDRDYDGVGWYFTDFDYHGAFDKAALHFLSVDDNASVWLNGSKVGDHGGANQPFKMDVTAHIQKGRNRLAVRIEDTGGFGGLTGSVEILPFSDEEDLMKGRYFNSRTPEHPPWAEGSVLYELNTRQFSREGTFQAVEERLDELRELGIGIIWFMPIHPIGELKRKGSLGSYYSVKDYYGINPEFGTLEDFKRLVDRIHELGMFVIIDMVANHTAWDNPLIDEHPDWYTHDKNGNIVAPVPDWHDVADLNYGNKALWTYMIDMMSYWVKEIDIDGYRCDVAEMVPVEFWIDVRKALDKIKPVFMLAEAETPRLNAYGFDMTYAGAMHRSMNAIAQGKAPLSRIDEHLQFEYYHYPKNSMRMRFTSNHDENTWNRSAISRMGREGAKAGAVLTFTLPGTPLIYNGQEAGLEKALDFFEKDPIPWKQSDFRALYTILSELYRLHPALYRGEMEKLKSGQDDRIYAFIRRDGDDGVLTIINFSSKSAQGAVRFNGAGLSLTDVFSGNVVAANDGGLRLDLKPWEYRVFTMH